MRPENKWNAGSCDELGVNLKSWGSKTEKISDPQDIPTSSIKCQEGQSYFMKSHDLKNETHLQNDQNGTEREVSYFQKPLELFPFTQDRALKSPIFV